MSEFILPFLKPVQPLLSAWLLLTSPTAEAQSINMLANIGYYIVDSGSTKIDSTYKWITPSGDTLSVNLTPSQIVELTNDTIYTGTQYSYLVIPPVGKTFKMPQQATNFNSNNYLSFYLNLTPGSGTPRNIMTLWHETMLQDSYLSGVYPVVSIWLYQYYSYASGYSAPGYSHFLAKNFVYSVLAQYQAFVQIKICAFYPKTPTVTSTTKFKSGLDKILVIRENSLNEFINFAEFKYVTGESRPILTTKGIVTGTLLDSTFSSNLASCPPVSFAYIADFSLVVNFAQTATASSSASGSILATSIFYQTLDTVTIDFVVQTWQADSSGVLTSSDVLLLYSTGYNTFYDLKIDATQFTTTGPQIVSAISFKSITGSLQICSLQVFGWAFCYAQSATPITFNPLLSFNSETTTIQVGVLNTYYDPDLLTQNNPFCSIGFSTGISFSINGAPIAIQYTLDPQSMMLTLTSISQLLSIITTSTPQTLNLSIADSRNPATVTLNANTIIQRTDGTSPAQSTTDSSPSPAQFWSYTSLIEKTHTIGLTNSQINLKELYYVQTGQNIQSIQLTQLYGNLPFDAISVESFTFKLAINLTDLSYNGTQSVFNLNTTLLNGQSNTNVTLTINFIAATAAQIAGSNTAPKFSAKLALPTPLPCFSSNAALRWNFTLPIAADAQNDKISFSLSCEKIDAQLFILTETENILVLFLNTALKSSQPVAGSYDCQITIADNHNANSTYTVGFIFGCQSLFAGVNKNNVSMKPPVPTIKSVDQNGKVTISWNDALEIPKNSSSKHSIVNQCYQTKPIQIQILPGSKLTAVQNLNFTYSITQFGQNETIVQIQFKTPALISIQNIHEKLSLSFSDPSCFLSETSSLKVNQSKSLTRNVPRQASGGVVQISDLSETAPKTLGQILIAIALATLILNLFQQVLGSQLLSLISSLGIILHMFLVTLDYPVEMMDFFNLLFPLVTFDVFPVTDSYEKWFHFEDITTDHPLTDQFDIVGYGSIFMVPNLGSLFLIACIQVLLPILFWPLQRFKPFRCLPSLQGAIDSYADSLIWSETLSFLAGNYLVLCTASFVGSTELRFGRQYNFTENFCSSLEAIGMVFSVVLPVTIFVLFRQKLRYIDPNLSRLEKITELMNAQKGGNTNSYGFDMYKDKNILQAVLLESEQHQAFMEKYDSLFSGLKFKYRSSLSIALVPVADLLLQLLIATSVSRLAQSPAAVIILLNFALLSYISFILHFLPYEDKWEQIGLLFNMITYLVLNYHLFLFTKFVDYNAYPQVANSVIYLIWANIAVNVILLTPNFVSGLSNNLKLRYMQRQHRKQMKARRHMVRVQEQFNIEENIVDERNNRAQWIDIDRGLAVAMVNAQKAQLEIIVEEEKSDEQSSSFEEQKKQQAEQHNQSQLARSQLAPSLIKQNLRGGNEYIEEEKQARVEPKGPLNHSQTEMQTSKKQSIEIKNKPPALKRGQATQRDISEADGGQNFMTPSLASAKDSQGLKANSLPQQLQKQQQHPVQPKIVLGPRQRKEFTAKEAYARFERDKKIELQAQYIVPQSIYKKQPQPVPGDMAQNQQVSNLQSLQTNKPSAFRQLSEIELDSYTETPREFDEEERLNQELLKEERDYRGKRKTAMETFNFAETRYFSTIPTFNLGADEDMREQYQAEYEFVLRNPDQEEYLNKYGLKRALQWEQVYNASMTRR